MGLKPSNALAMLVKAYLKDTNATLPELEKLLDIKKRAAARQRKRYKNTWEVRHATKLRVARWRARKKAERDKNDSTQPG